MKQQALYATDLFEMAEVKEDLQPIINLLRQPLVESWQDYRRRIEEADHGFAILPPKGVAQWLHYQIVDRAAALVSEWKREYRDDLSSYEIKNIFVVQFKGAYQISFKKLNRRLERSNYKTEHQKEYWANKLLPGYPKIIRLIVGYKTIKAGTEIEIHVTAPHLFNVVWSFELPNTSEAQTLKITEIVEQLPEKEIQKKGFKIKAKKIGKANKTDTESS
jgi:hypothetical protein